MKDAEPRGHSKERQGPKKGVHEEEEREDESKPRRVEGRKDGGGNLHYHNPTVGRRERQERWGHGSLCIWLTGLSGSGKSTLANALDRYLSLEYGSSIPSSSLSRTPLHGVEEVGGDRRDIKCYVLDGDNVRLGINRDLSFTREDRKENIRRVAEIAKLFVASNTIVITAFISPSREDRALAKAILSDGIDPGIAMKRANECGINDKVSDKRGKGKGLEEQAEGEQEQERTRLQRTSPPTFLEVYLSTSLDACIERDPKGLYQKALRGEIQYFTGVDPKAPYEPPSFPSTDSLKDGVNSSNAFLEIDTADGGTVEEHVKLIVKKLEELEIL